MKPPSLVRMKYLCEDLENWMRDLPWQLKNISITYLAIPGSHDSMTFSITKRSHISPDADTLIQSLRFLGPVLKLIMSRWSKTQAVDVTLQLKSGIRYFDLRTATKPDSGDFYFVHGMYAGDANRELQKINQFLETHPHEVVILDFQHFFAMGKLDHINLMEKISQIFDKKLLPYVPCMKHLTLKYLTEKNRYQVIAIYRSSAAKFGHNNLWPGVSFPTPWPNTVCPEILIYKLNEGLQLRNSDCGYVSQFVLTPTVWFVCKYLFGNLKSKCVLPLNKYKFRWINDQFPGPSGVNIIISDFVDLDDYKFSKEVVNLNAKLLKQYAEHISCSLTPID